MSPTQELAAALSSPTNDGLEDLTMGREEWDYQFYAEATGTLKEIMPCPLCGGPIKIVRGREQRWVYEVKCVGTCQPNHTFSVCPWFGPFFAQHFEKLLKVDPIFFEKYSRSCSPDELKDHQRMLNSRNSLPRGGSADSMQRWKAYAMKACMISPAPLWRRCPQILSRQQ